MTWEAMDRLGQLTKRGGRDMRTMRKVHCSVGLLEKNGHDGSQSASCIGGKLEDADPSHATCYSSLARAV